MKIHALSERRACRLISMSRSQFKYTSIKREDPLVIAAMLEIKDDQKAYGVPRLTAMLRRRGFIVNHKRVYRMAKSLGLLVPKRKSRPKLSIVGDGSRVEAIKPNHVWAMDFVSETLANGTKFRCFTVVDTFSRIAPVLHTSLSMSDFLPVRVLEGLKNSTTLPEVIVLDNGPEFKNHAMLEWSRQNNVRLHFIDPGTPTQNAFIESFNAKFRDECLNQHRFKTISEAQIKIAQWLRIYNFERPHSSLDYLTPKEFAELEDLKLSSENKLQKDLVDLKTG